jgi:hypothetical protein
MHFWGYRHVIEIPPQQVPAQPKTPDQSSGVRTEIAVIGKGRLVAGLNATFDAEAGHMEKIGKIKDKIAFAPEPEFHSSALLKRIASKPIHPAYFFCHASGGRGSSDSARRGRASSRRPGALRLKPA